MADPVITVQWPPVAGTTLYDLYKNGKKVSSTKATSAKFSVKHGDKLVVKPGAATPPPQPPSTMPTLDVHELTLQPNNYDPGGPPSASSMWMMGTSPETPHKAPNGEGPSRFMYKGDRYLTLKMYEWLTNEGVGRADNWHAWANPNNPPNYWEEAVSSRTFDIYSVGLKGHSGANLEANFEFERIQDTQDDQPHSGGMSVGLPAYLSARNVQHWLLVDCLLGNNEDGLFRAWDWATGQLVVDVAGINTISPNQTGVMPYEGGYNSSGVSAVAKTRQTLALYAKWRGDLPSTIAALLKDVPVFYDTFGTLAKAGSGATDSSIQKYVGKAQVPVSPLAP